MFVLQLEVQALLLELERQIMKNKGKAGILGTIAVLIIYVLLQWTGIISPNSEGNEESSRSTIDNSVIRESSEVPESIGTTQASVEIELTDYGFRSQKLQESHFEKHGIEMGFEAVEDYIEAANKVISNPDALHKLEAEDNDHIYFLEETNEFVVLSQDGYIRTYYIANGGINYFNRQ